jgi:hypothetical protein
METLREMKKALVEAEKANKKVSKLQKDLLEAHTKATREMHRSMLGKESVKKKK